MYYLSALPRKPRASEYFLTCVKPVFSDLLLLGLSIFPELLLLGLSFPRCINSNIMKSSLTAVRLWIITGSICAAAIIPNIHDHDSRTTPDVLPIHQDVSPRTNSSIRPRGNCYSYTESGASIACLDMADLVVDRHMRGFLPDLFSCNARKMAVLNTAVAGTRMYATAGVNALSEKFLDLPGNPASSFFGDQPDPFAADVLRAAAGSPDPDLRQAPALVSCNDVLNACGSPDEDHIMAYVDPRFPRVIVVCDLFFILPPVSPPCIGGLTTNGGISGVGSVSQASILLHEFTHAVTGAVIDDEAYGSVKSMALVTKQIKRPWLAPVRNADSYAWMATWAYQLGLSYSDADGLHPYCLRLFEEYKTTKKGGEGLTSAQLDDLLQARRRRNTVPTAPA